MSVLYENDFYGWTMKQADLLRSGRLNEIDLTNLIEEIETLGRSEKRALELSLGLLLQHLLKWKLQSLLRSRSWEITIKSQRREIEDLLDESPSLKPELDQAMQKVYAKAKGWVEVETGLSAQMFPEQCPWTFAEIINSEFLPE